MIQPISPRNKTFLGFVVDHFIETGSPVGSSTLISKYDIKWSAATVRQGLNSLMEAGFLAQSHISSGRFPTEKGINYYVENILQVEDSQDYDLSLLENKYEGIDGTLDHVISATSSMLSDFTKLAGLGMLPQRNTLRVKSAKLVRMGRKECLIFLVFEGGLTEKTYIRLARPISDSQLERIGGYLNRLILGLTIEQVRKVVLEKIKRTATDYSEILEKVLRISSELFERERKAGIFVEGKISVIDSLNFGDSALYRIIIEILEDHELLSGFLKSVVRDGRSKVFVGSEKGMPSGFSLVAAPYYKGNSYGSLGVFGPTRMDYSKIIPLVNYAAKMVTKRVNGETSE
ncbi:MAG: heat-inducible transcriptional repressor HrcA [Candidatus Dadabacteria bacterium]|nr:heat-inducible transcriptional repressor HrcA [Candidatus Dadabacteria bacterium]